MNRLILGTLVGAILGRGRSGGLGGAVRGLGGRGALVAMLLPYAMQWIQRNGGVGAVLKRFQEKGYSRQAASWLGTGDNEAIDPQAIDEVVDTQELSRLSQQLGVPPEDVRQSFAQALPEIVNQLSPHGQLKDDADRVIDDSLPDLQEEARQLRLQPHD